jgi:hypothetical protein
MAANEIVKANGSGHAPRQVTALQPLTLEDIWTMAQGAAESKLFPNVNTPQQAFTLMLLCQADGLHPMHAIRRYHIIQGRPTMRSDAVQAEFQADGGKIKIIRCDEHEARAVFSHPVHQPEGVEMSYTIEQAKAAGLSGGTWKTHSADMLWARLITKGVRRVHPGVVVGISTPEEVNDVVTIEAAHEVAKVEAALPPQRPAPRGDVPVPGQPSAPHGLDERPYVQVVTEATAAVNTLASQDAADKLDGEIPPAIVQGLTTREVHKWLLNAAAQAGHYAEAPPSKLQHAVAILGRIYQEHRDWMREQLNMCLESHIHNCGVAVQLEQERRAAESAQDAAEAGDEPLEPLPAGAREPGEEG